jgi:hypothetical protein
MGRGNFGHGPLHAGQIVRVGKAQQIPQGRGIELIVLAKETDGQRQFEAKDLGAVLSVSHGVK